MGPLLPLAALAVFLLAAGKRGNAAVAPSAAAVAAPAPGKPRPVPVQSVPATAKPRTPRPARPPTAAQGAAAPRAPLTGPVVEVEVPYISARPTPAARDEALEAANLAEKQTVQPKAQQQTVSVKPAADSPAQTAQIAPAGKFPPGYDSAAASARAQPMADHIRTRKGKYDHANLQGFQTAAGLKPDGLYGPQSAAALRYFGASNVPAPLFKGSQKTYAPPTGS